jgi:AcrR family transcriptional regulator
MHNRGMTKKTSAVRPVPRFGDRAAQGQVQREQTRAWIIECAIPVFAQYGPDVPVIGDFTAAAGVARGTFYNYFRSTRELLDAAIEQISNDVIALIAPVVRGMDDPVCRLATAARMYYRKATHDPVFRAFLGSVSGVGPLAQERIREDLRDAMDAGLLKVTDIELAQAITKGVMVFALKASNADDGGDERGKAVVRAILSGLGAHASRIERALRMDLPADVTATDSASD